MMRIAKIADCEADGAGKPGGLDGEAELGTAAEAGAEGAGASGTEGDESARNRGPGGSLRGRGGVAIGRGATEVSFAAGASPATSAGSEGMRTLGGVATGGTFGAPSSENEGLERRRIGGG